MSRIGKQPINIPAGVTVTVNEKNLVTVKGPKGQLMRPVDPDMIVKVDGDVLNVERPTEQKRHRAMHGLYRSLVFNMVHGVSAGYTTKQELVGVGYRATANGQILELALGFSHEIHLQIPTEVKVSTETLKGQNPVVTLESADKELIGMVAAKIRSFRKPEPYKGKGVRFVGEIIRRKAGKSAGKK